MATNPNRPEYQDTIESTWGQSVADHVVRRYSSPAERDADLAELLPGDLVGQMVAICPSSSIPYLETHDGVAWSPVVETRAGTGAVVTDVNGGADIPYAPLSRPPTGAFISMCLLGGFVVIETQTVDHLHAVFYDPGVNRYSGVSLPVTFLVTTAGRYMGGALTRPAGDGEGDDGEEASPK